MRLAAAGLAAAATVLHLGASGAAASPAASASAVSAQQERPHLQPWWYDALGLEEIHRTNTGEGVVVAVIDAYIDPDVPDLRGADITLERGCQRQEMPRLTDYRVDHGTSMATLIAGQGAGGQGILGVAPDVELRFYSLDYDPSNDRLECGAVPGSNIVLDAVKDGADVVSLSLSWGQPFYDYIEEAQELGAVVVAAAGERRVVYGQPTAVEYPGALPGVVGVYAADEQARPWERNPVQRPRTDTYAAITAPGVDIPTGLIVDDGRGWQSGVSSTGTSGATAITAGTFALLKAQWPEATANQLIQSMLHNASHGGEEGKLHWTDDLAYGLLSIGNAIDVDPTAYPDENPLLMSPEEAVEAFPERTYEPASTEGDGAPEQAENDPEPTEQGAEADATAPDGDADGGSGLPPVAMAAAGGLAVLALAGGALALRRRTHGDATTVDDTTTNEAGGAGSSATTRGTN